MYVETLIATLLFAGIFTVAAVIREHYTMLLIASGALVVGGVMLTSAGLDVHTGWHKTGNVTITNVSTTETVEEYDLNRSKTYTSIDAAHDDMPVAPSDAIGIMLLVAAAYLAVAGIAQPEFMW